MASNKTVDIEAIAKQIEELQAVLSAAMNEKRGAAVAEALQLVQTYKITAHELGLATTEKLGFKRKPAEIKYQNPANPRETWSGRGRQPKWIASTGLPLEKLKIVKQ